MTSKTERRMWCNNCKRMVNTDLSEQGPRMCLRCCLDNLRDDDQEQPDD